ALGLPGRPLHGLTLRDVGDEGHRPHTVGCLEVAQRDLDGELRAVVSPRYQVESLSHGPRARLLEVRHAMADVPGSYPLGEEDLQRLAQELGTRVAEHVLGLSIDRLDGSRSIDDHDRFGGGFEDRLRLGLAPANGSSGSPPLADVTG